MTSPKHKRLLRLQVDVQVVLHILLSNNTHSTQLYADLKIVLLSLDCLDLLLEPQRITSVDHVLPDALSKLSPAAEDKLNSQLGG